jgi:cell wall-associated NlpC family hydrolase
VKNQILLFLILIGVTSCTSLRRGNSSPAAASPQKQPSAAQSSPTFIENISIKPANGQSSVKTTTSAGKSTSSAYPALSNESGAEGSVTGLEANAGLLFKYAILLDVAVEEITDMRLIEFIDNWYGTRYRYGGNDKSGVDCSGFSKEFINNLYTTLIPRTSSEQYKQSKRVSKSNLQQGDLVFFYTRGRRNGVSHVGVYLCNNKFVHASTSNGVTINDLDDEYYARNYAGAGRVK